MAIVMRSEDKSLTPFVLCDACLDQIRGDGMVWVLAPSDGQARVGDVYFSHEGCQTRFAAENPEPPGWRWSRLDVHSFMELLARNSRGTPAEKAPVGIKPRLH